jgi:hypothetical protein
MTEPKTQTELSTLREQLRLTNAMLAAAVIWHYREYPASGTDARKLVTLVQGGMTWAGIRVWSSETRHWYNNNELETAKILCWADLPIAKGYWSRGKLIIREPYVNEDGGHIENYLEAFAAIREQQGE